MHYRYSIRFLDIRKSNIVHSDRIWYPQKIRLVCKMRNLNDLDTVELYNYIYLYKFFWGNQSHFTKTETVFDSNIISYSLRVCSISCKKRDIFDYLVFTSINFRECFDKTGYLQQNPGSRKSLICLGSNRNKNVFSEKKTNMGLFSLASGSLFLHLTGFRKSVGVSRWFYKYFHKYLGKKIKRLKKRVQKGGKPW
jgi:hypothetical protein